MKKLFVKLAIVMAAILSITFMFAGCIGGNNSKVYVIQYTDDAGTHSLTVTKGMPYSLESIPYKYGYEFLGLFDAETDGNQYVNAQGGSLSPFNESESKVLYPHFKAIEYTVILDYQGAAVTGERSLTVKYDDKLPELPKNLTLAHNEFAGWYTEKECCGTQVADAYGNLPTVAVLNEKNFELDDTTRRITLYAGFELKKYTVTFCFDGGLGDEEVQVAYNTPISEVVPKTRNSKGEAGLLWSTVANDTGKEHIFSGAITEEKTLYVAEWAPVIELNSNGGSEVTPVVARAKSAVSLPKPVKPLAKFLYWATMDGQRADITVMPSKSTTLKAVWQAKIEFDENGGTEVEDISEAAGTGITLPTPTREEYIFAGWYTADKEQFTRRDMPSEGIALKAGWYKQKTEKVDLNGSPSGAGYSNFLYAGEKDLPTNNWGKLMDLSDYLPAEGGVIKIKYIYHASLLNPVGGRGAIITYGKYFYDGTTVSDTYLVGKYTADVTSTDYKEFSFEINLTLTCNQIFVANYASCASGYGNRVYFYNVAREMTYGDRTHLYL